jgi:hypothetical protein
MSQTKITTNVLADGVALSNINKESSISFTKNVSTTGSISGSSISTNGTISGDSATLSGGLSAGTVTASDDITADGNISGDNISYDAESDTNTVSGDLEVVGQLTAPNQVADSDESVLTKKLLDLDKLEFKYTSIGSLLQTNGRTQFAGANGSIGFATTTIPFVGVTRVRYIYPIFLEHGQAISPDSAGSGTAFDPHKNYIIRLGMSTFRTSNASDVEIKFNMGRSGGEGTNRIGPVRSSQGFQFIITKNPSADNYVAKIAAGTSSGIGNISDASNTSPITITYSNHGLQNGDKVEIRGVEGNLAANGEWVVENVLQNTFDLVGSSGNGGYTTSTAGMHKISETIVLEKNTFYNFYLFWNFTERYLALFMGGLNEEPSLILNGIDTSSQIWIEQTAGMNYVVQAMDYAGPFGNFIYEVPVIARVN